MYFKKRMEFIQRDQLAWNNKFNLCKGVKVQLLPLFSCCFSPTVAPQTLTKNIEEIYLERSGKQACELHIHFTSTR